MEQSNQQELSGTIFWIELYDNFLKSIRVNETILNSSKIIDELGYFVINIIHTQYIESIENKDIKATVAWKKIYNALTYYKVLTSTEEKMLLEAMNKTSKPLTTKEIEKMLNNPKSTVTSPRITTDNKGNITIQYGNLDNITEAFYLNTYTISTDNKGNYIRKKSTKILRQVDNIFQEEILPTEEKIFNQEGELISYFYDKTTEKVKRKC